MRLDRTGIIIVTVRIALILTGSLMMTLILINKGV